MVHSGAPSSGLCYALSVARSSAGSSGELVTKVGLVRAASPGLGLGMLPWLATQKYELSKPPLVTSGLTPPQASVGDRVGGIIIAYSSFALSSTFNSNSFMMKCLRFKV